MVSAVTLALALALQAPSTGPELPRPTGPFAVGVARYQWTDSTRLELDPASPGRSRSLVVRVWYPAAGNVAPTGSPYVPQLETYAAESLIVRTRGLVARMRHYAASDAPVAPGSRRFPIVVFSAGNGEMEYMYTALLTELASQGYVVASISHPGVANVVFPDGHVVRRYPRLYDPKPGGWDSAFGTGASVALRRAVYDTMYTEAANYLESDVSLVLDRLAAPHSGTGPLAGRIDLGKVATIGHSYGGNVAVEACARDPRVSACASLDGGAFGPVRDIGLAKPLMIIRPAYVNDSTPRGLAQDQMLGTLRADGYDIMIGAGAQHRSFMDAFYIDNTVTAEATVARRVHDITTRYLTAFLGRYLEGRMSPLLDAVPADFAEVGMRALRLSIPAGGAYRDQRATALR